MKNLILLAFGLMTFTVSAQDTVRIGMEFKTVNDTEKVYDFVVSDFAKIIGFQYGMLFDGTKMTFKEVRNTLLDDMTNNSFNEAAPGEFRAVWIDKDFNVDDYFKQEVIYQLIFTVLQPGGSNICFSESPLQYEFIQYGQPVEFSLKSVIVHDDCHSGLPIPLNGTATSDPNELALNAVSQVFLGQDGTLAFSLTAPNNLSLRLFDGQGKDVYTQSTSTYAEGRHSISIGKSIVMGNYFLQATFENNLQQVISVVAR